MRLFRVLVIVFPLAGCGGIIQGSNDGGADAPTGSDAGPTGCPAAVPTGGGSCGTDGLSCEYGHNARWTCNTAATCSNGEWSVTAPALDCPTPVCPPGAVQEGEACELNTPACDNSTASLTNFCSCITGGPAMPDAGNFGWWTCSMVQPPCPSVIPQIGTSCTQPSLQCNYGVCAGPSGLAVECSSGVWVESNQTVPCPL